MTTAAQDGSSSSLTYTLVLFLYSGRTWRCLIHESFDPNILIYTSVLYKNTHTQKHTNRHTHTTPVQHQLNHQRSMFVKLRGRKTLLFFFFCQPYQTGNHKQQMSNYATTGRSNQLRLKQLWHFRLDQSLIRWYRYRGGHKNQCL